VTLGRSHCLLDISGSLCKGRVRLTNDYGAFSPKSLKRSIEEQEFASDTWVQWTAPIPLSAGVQRLEMWNNRHSCFSCSDLHMQKCDILSAFCHPSLSLSEEGHLYCVLDPLRTLVSCHWWPPGLPHTWAIIFLFQNCSLVRWKISSIQAYNYLHGYMKTKLGLFRSLNQTLDCKLLFKTFPHWVVPVRIYRKHCPFGQSFEIELGLENVYFPEWAVCILILHFIAM
jgi:hypothetical protein